MMEEIEEVEDEKRQSQSRTDIVQEPRKAATKVILKWNLLQVERKLFHYHDIMTIVFFFFLNLIIFLTTRK